MTIKKTYRKKFDQKLHDDNDPPSRAAVKKFIEQHMQMSVIDNPNEKGIDLILSNGKNIEVVRRPSADCLNYGLWTLPDIHLETRKAGWDPFSLFVVSGNCRYALFIHEDDIQKQIKNPKITDVINSQSSGAKEPFISLPNKIAGIIDLETGESTDLR